MNKITDYFNKNDYKNIEKYKYLIMLGLNIRNLKEFPIQDKVVKKYESELWKCIYNENVLQKRDNMSVFGYEDLGFWKGRTLECESIIEDLEELLK